MWNGALPKYWATRQDLSLGSYTSIACTRVNDHLCDGDLSTVIGSRFSVSAFYGQMAYPRPLQYSLGGSDGHVHRTRGFGRLKASPDEEIMAIAETDALVA
jgi:hypothetical protein